MERDRTSGELVCYVLLVFLPLFAAFSALLLWIRASQFSWVQALGGAALLATIVSACYFLLVWIFDRRADAPAATTDDILPETRGD